MININSVVIDELSSKININISATELVQVLFWKHEDFQDYTKAIDVSHLIPENIDGSYTFAINKFDVNLESFNGLFFLEFVFNQEDQEGQCDNESNRRIAVAANLISYHECLLNKVLSADINGCKQKKSNCVECEQNMLYIQVLISSLYSAIRFGFYEEAIRILETLNEMCEICNTCPPYGDTKLINGYGFGTVNNSVILM